MGENPFRVANRRIADKAQQLGVDYEIPFICECTKRACFRTIRSSVPAFEQLVGHEGRFLVLPGHPYPCRGIDAAA